MTKSEKKQIAHAHDKYCKGMLSNILIAIEVFKSFLPKELLKTLNLKTIVLESPSTIDSELKEFMADLVFKIQLKNTDEFIYIILEHFRKLPKEILFRLLGYSFGTMFQHFNNYKKVPFVARIVLHNRKKPYKNKKHESTNHIAEKIIKKHGISVPFTLIDIEQIIKDNGGKIPEMESKWIKIFLSVISTLPLSEYLNELTCLKEGLPNTIYKMTLAYIFETKFKSKSRFEKFLSKIGEKKMHKYLGARGDYYHDGLKAGIKKGIEKGREEGEMNFAYQLLKKTNDENLVQAVTGFSETKIAMLRGQLGKYIK